MKIQQRDRSPIDEIKRGTIALLYLQGLFASNDLSRSAEDLGNHDPGAKAEYYAVYGAIIGFDLYWNSTDIENNWSRLWGHAVTAQTKETSMHLLPTTAGAALVWQRRF